MGKDRSGKFHPEKGKPSGINKEEGLGIQATSPEHLKEYEEISGKYTEGEDTLSQAVNLRHPNRNTSRGENNYKGKENNQESDETINKTMTEETTSVTPEELPGVITKELFKDLALYEAPYCLTIYLGTHNAGVEVNERYDVVSFKNALQQAESMLKERNVEATIISGMLQQGYDLLRDDRFWLQLSPGLAVFIAEGYFKYIKMPQTAIEYISIEDSFYVTPLVPLMISTEYFYLLVISKKQCKLFKADAFNIQHISVEGLPKGIAEELADTNVETTFRTGGRGGTGGVNFHGMGGGNNNDDKAYLANYFEAVDDVIWKKVLHDETAPLLLAGVEYLIPVYKSVSDYNHIWDDALTGNHEYDDLPCLYAQSREKMAAYFQQRLNKALNNYGNLSATALTSSILDDIIPATYYSKVLQLFVERGKHLWGRFDEMGSAIQYMNEADEEAQDLVDNAVVRTIINGGEVFLLDRDKMPADSIMAATFRF